MRSLLLLLLLALAALAPHVHAEEFDSALAAEAPELVEHAADSFLTLEEMGEAEQPEESFAELESSSEAEEENENEAEADAEPEADAALVETEAETEAEAEAETEATPWHRDGGKNQPVNRNGGDVQCMDGDCTRAVAVRKAAVGTHPSQSTKPPPTKLDIALGAVKEEIMVRAKELHKEKDWSKKVATLIDEYQQKLQKVNNNIVQLRAQTKALLRKKKQIQNVQVQNKLRAKLQVAQADLNRLQKQMEHIAGKENEFADTERQLKTTMNALKNSLLKLRGQEPQKLAAEGIDLP